MTSTTWTTACCGQKITGVRAAHCAACHAGFTGVSAFDRHQLTGGCKDPAQCGLVLDGRGLWGWPRSERFTGFLIHKRPDPVV